jgi:hypothetical protein
VLWSEDGGPPRPGRLDLSPATLTLAGGSRLQPEFLEIPVAAIEHVRIGRRPHERVGGRTAVLLALRDGAAVAVASLAATGTLHELAERLWVLLGGEL